MPINFGIVGPGYIADEKLAPAIRATDGGTFWSVTSRSLKRAEEFAARHDASGEESAFDDYDAMLEDPGLDAVLVSTPDKLHGEHGIKAARAGKHVLMEKPMVASSRGGKKLLAACEENGVKLGVAYHLHWHEGHRKLIRKIRDGALGEIHHTRVQWTYQADDDSNWRADKEVGRWWALGRTGTHGLDLLRWVMTPICGEVLELESTISKAYWKGPHDETAMINLKFESGATAELTTSVLFDSDPEFKIYGSKGKGTCHDTLGPDGGGTIVLSDEKLDFPRVNPYEGEIEDFIKVIEEDREPEVPGEEGLRNVEILEKAAPEE